MKKRNVVEFGKNAIGTIFLIAAAFFMCSTFLSIKTVFADPIAPVQTPITSNRTSPRGTIRTPASTVARTAVSRDTTSSRNVNTGRTVSSRASVARTNSSENPRTVANRTQSSTARNVSSRNITTGGRGVISRSVMTPARVSVSGNPIRASVVSSSTYSVLSNKLYTGNYSNIIDSTTGLISADAYSACLDSYYTCMDEICTARSDTKGRCSCAGRATSFLAAEDALEKANEELINLSGQLALLVATKGKDVSVAFQLTDAEKVMNCVSYKDALEIAGTTKDQDGKIITKDQYMITWCQAHMMYDTQECSATVEPSYCSAANNNFGFDIKNIDGSSSDILASLKAWADAKDMAKSYTADDTGNLLTQYTGVSSIVSGLAGVTMGDTSNTSLDSLANTWGYELFEYAHNNVCGRVLDSCFNGIYEACGTPPSITDSDNKTHNKCMNGQTSNCPFNYNSYIYVDSDGDVALNERGSTSATTSSSASCFGYSTTTTTTSDPYASLRGPVADARRSIMQKYLLDANAACDVYGAGLQQTAQNIAYQKVAAQQALQQKRLEFYNEEQSAIASAYSSAISNFNECLSELYDCYTTQETSNPSWSTSRIKTYCAQSSNAPHCYDTMVCGTPGNVSTLQAVIDKADVDSCNATDDYETNTCRNIVTMAEVLSGSYASGATVGSSKDYREKCLQNISIDGVRNWERDKAQTPGWPDNN